MTAQNVDIIEICHVMILQNVYDLHYFLFVQPLHSFGHNRSSPEKKSIVQAKHQLQPSITINQQTSHHPTDLPENSPDISHLANQPFLYYLKH